MKSRYALVWYLVASILLLACSKKTPETTLVNESEQALITFVELGSVKCIPCKQLQPIMSSLAQKYGGQLNIVFYDVWQSDQRQYAEQYGIKLIPTQVFLDSSGIELMRHEGYFPEVEIDSFLVQRGLTPLVVDRPS